MSVNTPYSLKSFIASLPAYVFEIHRRTIAYPYGRYPARPRYENAYFAIDFFGNIGNVEKNLSVNQKVFFIIARQSVQPVEHGFFYAFYVAVYHI